MVSPEELYREDVERTGGHLAGATPFDALSDMAIENYLIAADMINQQTTPQEGEQ